MDVSTHYDVVVVGGRPAGSSLAARLGSAGLRVLLLDRAGFPSVPAVSYPAIFAGSMRLLDEIGVAEAEYALGTPKLRWWVHEFRDEFRTFSRVPDLEGRDYAYAIDRAHFDDALWRNAARFPSVTALQQCAATDLLWQNGRVAGVQARRSDGELATFTADLVVGAGGRFGLVANKAGARSIDVRTDLPTSVYYAYWHNAEPYDGGGPVFHVAAPSHGYGFLLMDSADGTLGVGIYGQSAIVDPGSASAETFYQRQLEAHPPVWRRLRQAERVTEVRGMRKIGNLYRTAGGPGWALAGDALYQTDPMDAQGIYHALFSAQALSRAILDWKNGAYTWEQALAEYEQQIRAETRSRYLATLARVKREIFTRRHAWAWKSYVRWVLDDPEYKRRNSLYMARGISGGNWLPWTVMGAAMFRGASSDAGRFLARRPRTNTLPPRKG